MEAVFCLKGVTYETLCDHIPVAVLRYSFCGVYGDEAMTTIHERYRAGINVLNNALKKHHTDKGGDPVMTRRLVATKRRWTQLYNRVNSPVALIESKVKS